MRRRERIDDQFFRALRGHDDVRRVDKGDRGVVGVVSPLQNKSTRTISMADKVRRIGNAHPEQLIRPPIPYFKLAIDVPSHKQSPYDTPTMDLNTVDLTMFIGTDKLVHWLRQHNGR